MQLAENAQVAIADSLGVSFTTIRQVSPLLRIQGLKKEER